MSERRARDTIVAALVGSVALLVLPIAALILQNVGPAARIRIYAYLISPQSLALGLFAAAVAVLLGIETHRLLAHRRAVAASDPAAPHRWLRTTQVAFAILGAWIAWPHIDAFPASGSVQAREAWARSHVPQYATLAALPAKLPLVHDEVGPIRSVAPTGTDSHGCGQSMNGFDMHFALDVIGSRGRGVLKIDCAVNDGAIVEWQSASWQFGGRTVAVPEPER